MTGQIEEQFLSCPVPFAPGEQVTMAHGGGGRVTKTLVESLFLPAFRNQLIEAEHDGAVFSAGPSRLAFSTDSYVVHPLVFPGGDIGDLAVNGTVNDLAMCGARPLFLSAGFLLEEGLDLATLRRVVESMARAAHAAEIQLVTGDTKVVDRGKGDGLYVNTAGIGEVVAKRPVAPREVRPGDALLVSGDLGRHGIAIMAVREGLEFESEIQSDCATVAGPTLALIEAGLDIHCLRDLTRGGLASATVEIAETAGLHIELEEAAIPLQPDVQGACEILGFDPLYVACEGRFACFLPRGQAEDALRILTSFPVSAGARVVGSVTDDAAGVVTLNTTIGAHRIVDMLSGEQLPRIC